MKLKDAVDRYVTFYQSLGRSAASLMHVRGCLGQFVSWCDTAGRVAVADVVDSDIAAYQNALRWQPSAHGGALGDHALSRKMSIVRQFFRWATEHQHVLLDPTRHLVIRVVRTLSRAPLEPAEVQALLEQPETDTVLGLRNRALLETLYGTGLRRSECIHLDMTDVDLRQRTLTIRHAKNGYGRLLPIGPNLAEWLQAYLTHSRPILNPHDGERAFFLSSTGHRLPGTQLARMVAVVAQRAGIERCVQPHDLRRSLGAHLLAAGADVRMVQEILGHETLTSTARYTQVQPRDTAAVFRAHHPRAKRQVKATDPPAPSS